jgi:hypothetical protein
LKDRIWKRMQGWNEKFYLGPAKRS